jgi:hypothetical protein
LLRALDATFCRSQDIFGAQIGTGNFDGTYLATVLKVTTLHLYDVLHVEADVIESFFFNNVRL